MEILFEWYTEKLDLAQKEKLEREINLKVIENIETLTHLAIETLAISLYEDKTTDAIVRGEVFKIEGQQRVLISRIQINHGFLIECQKKCWFQPR